MPPMAESPPAIRRCPPPCGGHAPQVRPRRPCRKCAGSTALRSHTPGEETFLGKTHIPRLARGALRTRSRSETQTFAMSTMQPTWRDSSVGATPRWRARHTPRRCWKTSSLEAKSSTRRGRRECDRDADSKSARWLQSWSCPPARPSAQHKHEVRNVP